MSKEWIQTSLSPIAQDRSDYWDPLRLMVANEPLRHFDVEIPPSALATKSALGYLWQNFAEGD